MKKNFFFAYVGAVIFLAAGYVRAEDLSTPTHLAGKFGIGLDSMPIVEGQPSYNSVYYNLYNSLALSYWVSDSAALQFFVLCNFYTYPGQDFSGNSLDTGNQLWGLGFGSKVTIKQPVNGLHIQFLGKATYAKYDGTNNQISRVDKNSDETIGIFGGFGFEYFLPFLDSLSLSANIGYELSYDDGSSSSHYNPSYYPSTPDSATSYGLWRGGVITNGLSLNSVTVNVYF